MSARKIDGEKFTREVSLEQTRAVDEEKRTVELAFSSEAPVERWFGLEVLDHSRGAADLTRLNTRAAVLVNHDPDQHVGVVENARIDEDRIGRATVRFGRSEQANAVFQDVVDGIRSLVSFGYRIKETETERAQTGDGGEGNGPDTVRVTAWEPMEISIVAVPADGAVGVGRSDDETKTEIPIKRVEQENIMADENITPKPEAPQVDIKQIRAEATKSERQRQTEINAIGSRMAKHNPDAAKICAEAIERGDSVDEVRKQVFESMPNVKPVNPKDDGKIGMSERDLSSYSIRKAALEASEGRLSGLEREVSDEWSKKVNRTPGSFWIPPDVLQQTRDLSVGTATLGGNLVATNLLAGSFIDLLRNRMVIAQLGAQTLDGLVGDVAIPRQTGGVTTYWVTETQATTESNAAFDQVSLTPKGLTALQDVTKNLLIQSTPSVEQLIRNDLATALALAVDAAAINGAGTAGQPTGILNTSGIGSVATSGTTGGALTWANTVALETEVAQDNADMGSLAYLTNAKVRGAAKGIQKSTSSEAFIWGDNANAEGMVNGYRALVSNQVPSNLTEVGASELSAMIFGNFADVLIGQWGGLEILVDPYTAAGTRIVKMYATLFTDVAIRHAESFAAIQDIST